jgi:hypothetical protein
LQAPAAVNRDMVQKLGCRCAAEKIGTVDLDAGFGEQPMMLFTNLPLRSRDSESLWWVAQIY